MILRAVPTFLYNLAPRTVASPVRAEEKLMFGEVNLGDDRHMVESGRRQIAMALERAPRVGDNDLRAANVADQSGVPHPGYGMSRIGRG